MATWYRFGRDHDHKVNARVTVAYREGDEFLIPEAHARAADEAQAGERIERPADAVGRSGRRRAPDAGSR